MEFSKHISEIHNQIEKFVSEGKSLFMTSSFQSHSIPLLHIMSGFKENVDFYFINTGFHFVETHAFKNEVASLLNIEIKNAESPIPKTNQLDENGFFYYASNTDYCCHLNKVLPTDALLQEYDVWINGVRRDQSSFRKNLKDIEKTPNGSLRYHPILDWNSKMIYDYAKTNKLPKHPMEAKGYQSIGCQPCTVSIEDSLNDQERSGRWFGQSKSECGLHTNLIKK